MAISFEAIAERYVTFLAGNTAAEGKLCKITANGTVGACAGGDDFCGVITQVRNGAASVLMGGFVKLPYTGAAPALGFTALVADGASGVRVPAAATETKPAETGRSHLVVNVDTANKTVGPFL